MPKIELECKKNGLSIQDVDSVIEKFYELVAGWDHKYGLDSERSRHIIWIADELHNYWNMQDLSGEERKWNNWKNTFKD